MKNSFLFLVLLSINLSTAEDHKNAEINALLDGLHQDAHEGNFQSYFDRYTSDAIFLGTDKTERWSVEEFKAYAEPAFADGNGWTIQL